MLPVLEARKWLVALKTKTMTATEVESLEAAAAIQTENKSEKDNALVWQQANQ